MPGGSSRKRRSASCSAIRSIRTRAGLLGSIPGGAPGTRLTRHSRHRPAPGSLPPGCCFTPRCPVALRALPDRASGRSPTSAADRTVKCYLHGPAVEPEVAPPGAAAGGTASRERRWAGPDAAARRPQSREGVLTRSAGSFARPSSCAPSTTSRFSIERGRDVRPGRRIGQRKDDDRPVHPAADRADVGRGGVQGRGRAALLAERGCGRRAATCRSSSRIRIRRSTRGCASATSSRSR